MNNAVKIGAGVAVVGVLAVGGLGYMASTTSDLVQARLTESVSQLNANLPAGSTVENTISSSSMFNTEGTYKISVPNEDKELSGGATITYKVEHGFDTLFGGDIKVSGEVKPEGEVVKTVSLTVPNGVSQTFEGTLKNSGDINLNITHNDISANIPEAYLGGDADGKGVTVTAKGQKDVLSYNFETKALEWTYSGLNLSVQDNADAEQKIVAKNVSGAYNMDMNKNTYGKPFQGKAMFKAGEVVSGNNELVIKDLSISTDSSITNKKYNMTVNSKVGSVSGFGQKDIGGELSVSINDLNEETLGLFNKIKKAMGKGQDITAQDREEAKTVLNKDLNDGFSVSINKLVVKNEKNELDFSLKLGVSPTNGDNKFSLYKNGLFDSSLSIKGEFAQPIAMVVTSTLGLEAPNPQASVEEFKVKANYKEGVLTINDATAKPDVLELFTNSVKTADGELGFEVVDVVPVTVEEEKIVVTPEQSTTAPTEEPVAQKQLAEPKATEPETVNNNNKQVDKK